MLASNSPKVGFDCYLLLQGRNEECRCPLATALQPDQMVRLAQGSCLQQRQENGLWQGEFISHFLAIHPASSVIG